MKIRCVGSPSLETSTANQELVGQPEGWTNGYNFKEFSFMNDQACTVKINGDDAIYLRAGQGFSVSKDSDLYTIDSFVVVESGITFNFIGGY